jgi:AcrR family transcriptional regulator
VTRGAQAHYFATKADLVIQALRHLTEHMVAELVAYPWRDVRGLREQYETLLDRLWEVHAGPGCGALLELFVASRTDEELGTALRDFDHAVASTLEQTSRTVAPELADRDDFRTLMITGIAAIRGLWLLRAVASERQVRRLWPAARAQLTAGAGLADG